MSGLSSFTEYALLTSDYSVALAVIAAIIYLVLTLWVAFNGWKARPAVRAFGYLSLYLFVRFITFCLRAADRDHFTLSLHAAYLSLEVIGGGLLVLAIGVILFDFVSKAVELGVDAFFGIRVLNLYEGWELDAVNHLSVAISVALGIVGAVYTTQVEDADKIARSRDYTRASAIILLWVACGYVMVVIGLFVGLYLAGKRGYKSRSVEEPVIAADTSAFNTFVANVKSLTKNLYVPLLPVCLLLLGRYIYVLLTTGANPLLDVVWHEKAFYPMTVLLEFVIVALLTLKGAYDFVQLKA